MRLADQQQFSVYNFDAADVEKTWKHFELYEAECKALVEKYFAEEKDATAGCDVSRVPAQFPALAATTCV